MAFEQKAESTEMKEDSNLLWECKECHRLVEAERTVAYHLIDKVLYGWCESCFSHRGQGPTTS